MLAPEWLGQRVVVRRRSPGPAGAPLTDALGDLIGLTENRVTIATRSGPITFDRADVVLARLVPASTAAQLRLEAVAARGWRAAEAVTTADGWLLRADHGWTGRANSALPLRTPRRPLEEVLREVTDWYAQRDLPPRIEVPMPAAAALDRGLEHRGWGWVEDVAMLAVRLDVLTTGTRTRAGPPLTTRTAAHPGDDWLAAYHYRGGPLPAHAGDLLARHDRVTFLSLHAAGADRPVVAIARAVVDEGWLGVTALEVVPAYRRLGVATTLMGTAADWAIVHGAERCYLQVGLDNPGALSFYARLGFHRHHTYRYREAPRID